VTPAAGVARQLKGQMQTYYTKAYPGLKITTVTCKIARSGASATCKAHFAYVRQRTIGVFTIAVVGSGGSAQTKTVAVSCTDTKTGKKLACFQ
jgi:hypothetical protein